MKTVWNMLTNIKVLKWSYMRGTEDEIIATDLILWDRIILGKGSWDGLYCHSSGLGLHRSERQLFGAKFLKLRTKFTVYFLKWIIDFCPSLQVVKDNYSFVVVEEERLVLPQFNVQVKEC